MGNLSKENMEALKGSNIQKFNSTHLSTSILAKKILTILTNKTTPAIQAKTIPILNTFVKTYLFFAKYYEKRSLVPASVCFLRQWNLDIKFVYSFSTEKLGARLRYARNKNQFTSMLPLRSPQCDDRRQGLREVWYFPDKGQKPPFYGWWCP